MKKFIVTFLKRGAPFGILGWLTSGIIWFFIKHD